MQSASRRIHGRHCAAVVPAIANANPKTALSWASYLTDYGVWGPGRESGQLEHTLKYNGAYRRDVLLELGDRLDELLDANNEELWPTCIGRAITPASIATRAPIT